jgi:hypothetical protein
VNFHENQFGGKRMDLGWQDVLTGMTRTTAGIPGILEEVTDKEPVMTVSAHYDGKAIIPDEPLDLPPNQALIVQIESVGAREPAADESALAWLAANAVENDALPADLADQHDHYLYGCPTKDRQR